MTRPLERDDTVSVLPGEACTELVPDPVDLTGWRARRGPVHPWDPDVYDRNRIVCHSGHTPEVDLFRMLAAQAVLWLEERQGHSLCITSCGGGEGKTLISANLAICLAKNSNYETVLVDADLRRPNVCNMLGVEADLGLEQALNGSAALDECLLQSEIDGLYILPTKAAITPSSRLLSSARLSRLAADIEAAYPDRLVVYDMPPMLLGDSCAPFLKAAAGCLMVVEEGRTTRAHLRRALSLVREEKLIGVILNKASEWTAQQYGYITYDYYADKAA